MAPACLLHGFGRRACRLAALAPASADVLLLRTSPGLAPNRLRKLRLKCDTSEKPAANAIALMDMLAWRALLSMRRASSSRCSSTKLNIAALTASRRNFIEQL